MKNILFAVFLITISMRAFAFVGLLSDENINDIANFIIYKTNEKADKITYFKESDLDEAIKACEDFDFDMYKKQAEVLIKKEEEIRNKGLSDEEKRRNFLLGKNLRKLNSENEKFAKNIPLFLAKKISKEVKAQNIKYDKFYIEFSDDGLILIFSENKEKIENFKLEMKILGNKAKIITS